MHYQKIDCLYHLNFKAMRKLFTETLFKERHEICKLVEVTNFDKYQILLSDANRKSKTEKDLLEMRFVQMFEDTMKELDSKYGGKLVLVFSFEKKDILSVDCFQSLLKHKV